MSRSNRTRYALLGALSLGEKSGYDLKKEFEHRMRHFWSESLGQIYPTLHRLRADKLVAVRADNAGRRPGTLLYSLTEKGRHELREWLVQAPERESVRNELLLKLFFGQELGTDAAIRHLEEFEQRLHEDRHAYGGMTGEIDRQAVSTEQRTFWHLALMSGLDVTEARLRWCRKALRTLREMPKPASGDAAGKARSRA